MAGKLSILSFGAGQESTAIAYLLALDQGFRKIYAPDDLLILGSDTGDEHPETYAHIEWMKKWCKEKGLEFVWITSDMGFHGETWKTLTTQYRHNGNIGSRQYSRTCTDNLKLSPFRRALAVWIRDRYFPGEFANGPALRRQVFPAFKERYGKIEVMLGFASTERRRMEKSVAALNNPESALPRWYRENFTLTFPLIDALGWDRKATQDYMRRVGLPVPVPSNCLRCHFRGPVELLWLSRNHPAKMREWIELEAAKIAKYRERGLADDKNQGVYGKKLLPEALADAERQFGHMTNAELEDYRMSHGHCVSNAF